MRTLFAVTLALVGIVAVVGWMIFLATSLHHIGGTLDRVAAKLGGVASVSDAQARAIRLLIDKDRRAEALALYRDITGEGPEAAEAGVDVIDRQR